MRIRYKATMAEGSRDDILSIFQEITRIENFNLCIEILEQHDWNLQEAVQNAIPPEVCSPSADILPGGPTTQNSNEASPSLPSSSPFENASLALDYPVETKHLPRMLTFNVEYESRTISLSLPDTDTVGSIKDELSRRLSIPVSDQELKGWSSSKVDDKKPLKDLHLSTETKLKLHNTKSKFGPPVVKPKYSNAAAESSSSTSLKCSTSADAKLAGNSNSQKDKMEIADEDDDDLVDDYDDDDMIPDSMIEDDIWTPSKPKCGPLMPEDFTDECEAQQQFTRGFIDRFGECHPAFYIGTLDDAVKDSLMLRAKERKPLAVYLHDDNNIVTNVFCSKMLCSEEIVNYLTENFFVWAWDMTNDKNKARLLTMATRHFGMIASSQIKSYIPNKLPLLLIISRARSTNEVSTVIQGCINLDELMSSLITAFELFQDQQRQDVMEEEERERRELIKREQDEAYEASLVADRLKEERLQQEIEFEKIAQQKREEEELARLESERNKAQMRENIAKELPAEPAENIKGVVQIRLHLPSGNIVTRRFYGQEPLRYLFQFLTSKGYPTDEFKVLSRYPQQDVSIY
ncbi:FAF1 [Acanthosepion pharaonis]|uniref:FAF1 n=1 Tax=Acanthosepion pharaonis TaxID=158019 RepID=A0A812DV40_ACAPH|nr:FAF1 [Sepia pharaonis]